ncbi:MAG: 3-methyl-2-oxobutanoate dehydrogenase subunit VorB [Candidatus Marinimicrobia bacterium]|jgi:2-oxoglutarate ferredoxin oxidoreductase subunit alpha|nr:3-methyl-2-oxobutanoate dehydrogenase subunit VorB [Candidatus Neomarinimicrobiota bacterium]MDP7653468.1 3-methyl-2-oxobutanoate dehydrogenase subunit VorB [Candidatus Neomarinimicrobiota bacterium]|tara:strand:- start:1906 stop:2970 length:1065 start_codon:yes stop_codon:yes gene_type:complete
MKGNEALAEAAIRAGLKGYFGYPITPQSELLEYLAAELPKRGGVMVQAESEVASINMVYGAAGTGERVMTSTSSPGFSLMQEGVSYIACTELPCLLVNVVRGGPGLGTIQPAQSDYFQAVKGGGHGDYKIIVLAPSSVQEMADFVYRGFDLADEYRMPVLILADGAIGQMMEAVEFPEYDPEKDRVDHSSWTTVGQPEDEERHIITSLFLDPDIMEKVNLKLQDKYKTIQEKEVQFETVMVEDANYLVVAYGLSARVSHKAVELAREQGIKVGLLRPQTLFPFPSDALSNYASKVQRMLVVEMNAGQMVEDVRLAVEGKVPIEFYGKMGGAIPTPEEVLDQIKILSSFKIVKGS